MKIHQLPLMLFIFILYIGCAGPDKKTSNASSALTDDDVVKIAREAYVFGYPLVLMDLSKKVLTNVDVYTGSNAPVNVISHRRIFPDHTFTAVVKPNCDTYYSSGWFDLKAEPLVLTVPATNRYYLLPMLDAYTNVFASPGPRTTGKGAHIFLITGPGWNQDTIPAGMERISSPTNMVWMIGRTQVNSKEDGEKNVVPFQEGIRLVPLSSYGKAAAPVTGILNAAYDDIVPVKDASAMNAEGYFNYVSLLMADNPPAKADAVLVRQMASIGIIPGKPFSMEGMSASLRKKLDSIPGQVLAGFKKAAASKDPSDATNGWMYRTTPLGNFGTDYLTRALVAFLGLGANLPEDAIYPNAVTDSDGQPLEAMHKYVVHFDKSQIPSVNAFWSLTMYNHLNFLAENPINRYVIGDRNKLKYNPDRSLDIYVQRDSPGKGKEANWLPTPKEKNFELTIRMYWPKEVVLNKTWIPPTIKKIG